MTQSDEYRANAQECERMAGITTNPADKVTWLQMAADWLRLIPSPPPSDLEIRHAREDGRTHQPTSDARDDRGALGISTPWWIDAWHFAAALPFKSGTLTMVLLPG